MKLPIYGLIALCLAQVIPAFVAGAAAKQSDAEITREMLGAWVVPRTSTDYSDQLSRALETYRADGTYVTELFSDAACTKVNVRVISHWSINDGMMISIYANGNKDVDEVVSIGNGKLRLHSLSDGTTYTRVKADNCGKPTS